MKAAAAVGWQDIATALARRASRDARSNPQRRGGFRRISQEAVAGIRRDTEAGMPRAEVAAKYGVSRQYVYQVVECGLRDDEREKLR